MKHRIVMALLAALWSLAGIGDAHATGFSIYEAGSRATALGGAFTARADDGSALYYNAAGLSFRPGRVVDVNVVVIRPNFKFTGQLDKTGPVDVGKSETNTFFVPGVYYTSNTGGRLAWGVGAYAPFGLGVEWKDQEDWIGRRVSHDVGIETIYVTPAVSYLATDQLAVALGLDVAYQSLHLKRYSPHPYTGENALHVELDGNSNLNVTPSVGVMYKPRPELTFGFMYHHKKTMKFEEGEAQFTNVMGTPDPLDPFDPAHYGETLAANLGPRQTLGTEVELPSIMSVGARWRFHERVDLEANYVRFGWSTLEGLDLSFEDPALDQTIHLGYEDSWQLRVGTEVMAMREKLWLMGGYVRDTTPQPLTSVSPLLPDSDRNDWSFGALARFGRWDVNVSYMYVDGEKRTNIEDGEPVRNTADYPFGTYSANANLFGVGATFHF